MKYLFILFLSCSVFGSDVMFRATRHFIGRNEGVRFKPYRCTNGHWTIGVGHKIKKENLEFFREVSPISNKQIQKLFNEDIEEHLKRAKLALPDFDKYPVIVQVVILDGFFRGCLGGSPLTLRMIRIGEWQEASKEYLNHAGYRRSKEKKTGVYKRMDRNARIFLLYGEKLDG